ncbi:hypothetical protein ACQP00_19400 [Dactylosporangium sp. CS-047395]|uniref:hypothetical protein n=1 Tax=Dactylosporangium sp. CS-047395 TaxID=3239936 RepID=UPI003D8C775E
MGKHRFDHRQREGHVGAIAVIVGSLAIVAKRAVTSLLQPPVERGEIGPHRLV